MNLVRQTYNRCAGDVFANNTTMDYASAKYYIDDAYDKRAIVRKAIQFARECETGGQSSYFCAVAKRAYREYRSAQKLSVRAYRKCMADIKTFRYFY